jgi:toxin HigB-1
MLMQTSQIYDVGFPGNGNAFLSLLQQRQKCDRIDKICFTCYASRNILGSMIKTFHCKETARLFDDRMVDRFQAVERQARRKLMYLHRGRNLQDLRQPPGNQLEALKGGRQGHSIRINDQWRICFNWENGDAYNVEIVDYH